MFQPRGEPFCRAFEGLSNAFANCSDLAIKHRCYIDIPQWDIPFDNAPTPVKAVKYELNPGVFDSTGKQTYQPPRIRVDGAMIAAVGILSMKLALAAIIEAIFVVVGKPDIKLRQCPLPWTTSLP